MLTCDAKERDTENTRNVYGIGKAPHYKMPISISLPPLHSIDNSFLICINFSPITACRARATEIVVKYIWIFYCHGKSTLVMPPTRSFVKCELCVYLRMRFRLKLFSPRTFFMCMCHHEVPFSVSRITL
jgi:hypothetical protein